MNKDLTTGKPASVLLRFTLPMLLSVAFQQLYNIADSVIAGKFAGEDALAAVGASYPVTMIFMAVAFGMNIGISVVISQLFGAKDFKEMKTAAYTGFISVAVGHRGGAVRSLGHQHRPCFLAGVSAAEAFARCLTPGISG